MELSTIVVAGLQLSFQCKEGLVPEGTQRAKCSHDGRWDPDPLYICNNATTTEEVTSIKEATTEIS